MGNRKLDFIIVAFNVFLYLAYANPPNCADCIGDKLMDAITQYDVDVQCFYIKHKDFLPKVKLYTTEAMAANLREALLKCNDLTEETCRTDVPFDTCDMEATGDDMLKCYMDSAKKLAAAIRDLEICHGKALKIDEMRIAITFIRGSSAAFKVFHTDC